MQPTDKRVPTVEQWEALADKIDGAGGIKTLTTADYNYPTTGTKTCIALWLLDDGFYVVKNDIQGSFAIQASSKMPGSGGVGEVDFVASQPGYDAVLIKYSGLNGRANYCIYEDYSGLYTSFTDTNSLSSGRFYKVPSPTVNNLTSTSTTSPLSAAQGKYLNDTKADKTAFTGTDGTATGTAGLVPAPATTDAGKFLKADGSWGEVGGDESPFYLVTFTGAYSSSNYSDKTVDEIKAAFDAGKIPLFYFKDDTWGRFYAVSGNMSSNNWKIFQTLIVVGRAIGGNVPSFAHVSVDYNSTQNKYVYKSLPVNDIVDRLTSTDTRQPLSANQGKVLNDKIEGRLKTNAGAPTTSTVGTVGMLLEDTTNGNLYICTNSASPYAWKQIDKDEILTNAGAPTTSTAGTLGQLLTDTTNAKLYQLTAIDNTDPQNPSYTWTEVGGSSGPTVVQTTGTSTTDVMSQNAVGTMVFAYPISKEGVCIGSGCSVAGKSQVAIGKNAYASGESSIAIGWGSVRQYSAQATGSISVAIGSTARATAKSAIALGDRAYANVQGVMSINSGDSQGYNNSNYRLLTGLYDPQTAHDAATKGYVDNAVINGGTTQPTTSTVGAVGTQYNCVNNGEPEIYICTAVDTSTTPNTYTWKKVGLTLQLSTTDPGEGSPLADNTLLGIYE